MTNDQNSPGETTTTNVTAYNTNNPIANITQGSHAPLGPQQSQQQRIAAEKLTQQQTVSFFLKLTL